MEGIKSKKNFIKYDEIKRLLKLPEFKGIRCANSYNNFVVTLPSSSEVSNSASSSLINIPAEILRNNNSGSLLRVPSGDHGPDNENKENVARNNAWSEEDGAWTNTKESSGVQIPYSSIPDLLSGYDEYLKAFYNGSSNGVLRVTTQGTLSLSFGTGMQVDVSINGAIRVVNPKAHIAIGINHDGLATAVMHPMGRVHHEGETALLMAWDMQNGIHKYAKLWPDKSSFKSSDMSFSYTMDSAGTRTTMTQLPKISTNDISLPVFYDTSPHGSQFKNEAEAAMNGAKSYTDAQGFHVWKFCNVIIKYLDGELRIARPPTVHMRTSAVTGCLGISTDALHCTATQGDMCHMFVRFGLNKMHYNGQNFKIRTQGQSAGFDEQNRITLF
ncbi:uncharacterized protein LOC132203077 [Neocloeon triangulifer]|uniref:uncharacterized protein LOC132203077 n=1 Tax=Neocloeon triangulifer TaxID=2078957 RepID=UPI00286F6CC5|nr:uncharacterized protein LOC132203077 [Neocloeon triangulifer]